jgi:hypothetical protein
MGKAKVRVVLKDKGSDDPNYGLKKKAEATDIPEDEKLRKGPLSGERPKKG